MDSWIGAVGEGPILQVPIQKTVREEYHLFATSSAGIPRPGSCYHSRPYDRRIRPWQILWPPDAVRGGLDPVQSRQPLWPRGGQRVGQVDLPEDPRRRRYRER